MQISLEKPELERFVREQVRAGHYPSVEAVVEAAIAELRDVQAEALDDDAIDANQRGGSAGGPRRGGGSRHGSATSEAIVVNATTSVGTAP
jgi:Arc/MetJ-type ribon-helix-helix transcriptional regulator